MSNAAGWFPQFFAVDGAVADVLVKTAAGVTVQTYENAAFIGPASTSREELLADRTYYVATTGSDVANDGLSVGSPFLTVQKVFDVVQRLDFNSRVVTIRVAAGTYADRAQLTSAIPGQLSPDKLILVGDESTPSNVVFSYSGAAVSTILAQFGAMLSVRGIKFSGATNYALLAYRVGYIDFQNCEFGAATYQLYAGEGGSIRATGNYAITAGGGAHMRADMGGRLRIVGITATLTGTPAFSTAFAQATHVGIIVANGNTYTGSATGSRYVSDLNSAINTVGGGASYFPGNSAGSTATGGQYA